ncbi:universal stress protein [Mycobacterium sp. AMU20-3851]|uniref:universal stress protein n=1 Tax=Mycobacterium sp. AMU20-3851 TaxID=3122055 RepID=UPI0037546161
MTEAAQPVVVGVDGSTSAVAAAGWAAGIAARLGAPLHIVYAMPYLGHNFSDAAAAVRAAAIAGQHEAAESILGAAADAVRRSEPGLEVTTSAPSEPADEVLRALGAQSRLIVLGSQEVSAAAALLVGSLTLKTIGSAACPVVAWRGEATAPTTQPVLVGVDDKSSDTALGLAFEIADALKVPLRAVRSWSSRRPPGDVTIPFLVDWDALEAMEWTALTAAVEPWAQRYPDVEVGLFVEPAKPSQALLKHLDDAQLVVVGTRGHGVLTSTLIGSTSLNLLHHSPVPVAVCRPAAD